jgi:hypothetical protein
VVVRARRRISAGCGLASAAIDELVWINAKILQTLTGTLVGGVDDYHIFQARPLLFWSFDDTAEPQPG